MRYCNDIMTNETNTENRIPILPNTWIFSRPNISSQRNNRIFGDLMYLDFGDRTYSVTAHRIQQIRSTWIFNIPDDNGWASNIVFVSEYIFPDAKLFSLISVLIYLSIVYGVRMTKKCDLRLHGNFTSIFFEQIDRHSFSIHFLVT